MEPAIKVITWRWDNGEHPKKHLRFSANHVNILYRMLDRFTTVPYEKVCITDDPKGIDPDIRIVPLWDDLRDMGACYTRLKAFAPEMQHILGPKFLWLDLDTVICGNMDHILTDPSDFKMYADTHNRTYYNGSVVMYKSGTYPTLWTEFNRRESPRVGKLRGFIGSDQAWISAHLGPHQPKFKTDDGIYSFRIHFEKINRRSLPTNASMILFHGRHDPSQPEVQARYPWVKEYWR